MNASTGKALAKDIAASLNAKLERLLARPIIARIVGAGFEPSAPAAAPAAFLTLLAASSGSRPTHDDAWSVDPETGICTVRISIDYGDLWRGCEKEIIDAVTGTLESPVAFLTHEQRALLERAPREFLALRPRPETAELVAFERERIGGSEQVVVLRFSEAPESRAHLQHIAIVPNLVQIERQLDALRRLEAAADDGPLGPLRALIGAGAAAALPATAADASVPTLPVGGLDEYQRACVEMACTTPHFCVIEGPPGSGKTTVITAIIRRALARGERVLVVSPTHVAVDNVVEKLVAMRPEQGDNLATSTLPVRFAARTSKLSAKALDYWVGAKAQRRGATIARRVQARLTDSVPFAAALFEREDADAPGQAPISAAIAGVASVVCGTPIGILSFEPVKMANDGAFDLLIVDEVSKMTLPEFLAIAVKARRWVMVGDPAQLPPFNNSEENATTLDDVLSPTLELACSVSAILERVKPAFRRDERLVVVASHPASATRAITAQLDAVMADSAPAVALLGPDSDASIIVCTAAELDRACTALGSRAAGGRGETRILVERGLTVARPAFASGRQLVEPKQRAGAAIFENAFNVYHAQPWSIRSEQRLPVVLFRRGLEKYMPAPAAHGIESEDDQAASADPSYDETHDALVRRFAINTVSVFDWLTGIPTDGFDVSPLRDLGALTNDALCAAVRPYVGSLKKQYRMHATLSRVPRELFYFGDALLDGKPDDAGTPRVVLVQVDGDRDEETNTAEADKILEMLGELNGDNAANDARSEVMLITPYREQEAHLRSSLEADDGRQRTTTLDLDVCTLDRCQGREADYVFISLVRGRATTFFDMPKRWNVALTRAKEGLVIVGDIDAYLAEAASARRDANGSMCGERRRPRQDACPQMSVLARVLEAYSHQIQQAATRLVGGAR